MSLTKKYLKKHLVIHLKHQQKQPISTTNKEENQIIVNNINENKGKLYKKDETGLFYDYVIQPSGPRNNLVEAINLILDFNETILLDLV